MHDLLSFCLISLITCITPGAGVLCTVSVALRHGMRFFWIAPTGNAFGVLTMSILSATGLGAVITSTPLLYTCLQGAGALVLIWLGYKNWTAQSLDLVKVGQFQHTDGRPLVIFRNSVLLQTTNPMLMVFLLSLMPPFIAPTDHYISRVTLLIACFVGICWIVHLVYSALAARVSYLIAGNRFSWWLNRISAVLFWMFAASVLWRLIACD